MAEDGNAYPTLPEPSGVTEREVEDIEERSRLRVPVIYEIVRREGEIEMARPAASLWWSGVAAGLSISFSLLAQAVLYMNLPAAGWRPLLTGFGYSFGFVVVVLPAAAVHREYVVLPVAAEPSRRNVGRLMRMWSIVLAANLTGTLAAGIFCAVTPALSPDLRAAMIEISRHSLAGAPLPLFFGAISAGFLVAAMVWLIPSAEGTQFHVITIITYLIAIGGFPHVVAGSVEAFLLLAHGDLGPGGVLGFLLPLLAGNVIGGTALFAVLSYAQVMHEIRPASR